MIVIDIETIGATSKPICDYIAANIKPPGTIKLPASIEKWNKESKAEAIAEAIEKTGLDGAFGQVVCIGYDLHDTGQPEAVYGLDEPDLLTRFNAALDTIPKNMHNATTVVGHNVSSFDLRFLFQRYVVNGIRPHAIINYAAKSKPWETDKVYDTMTQFAGFGNKISLDKLCMALGIPTPKGDMDGSMVGKAVADGRLLEVVEYCKRDVSATRLAYRRLTFADSPGIKAECFYDELAF
jgi:hypothetical protein